MTYRDIRLFDWHMPIVVTSQEVSTVGQSLVEMSSKDDY